MRILMKVRLFFLLATFIFAASPVFAGEPADAGLILAQLHVINTAEVDAGRLAQTQGIRESVKTFGSDLERDHQAADEKVVALAEDLGVDFDSFAEEADVKALK